MSQYGFDARLYRIVMEQVYHYTRHNSVNQAIAVLNVAPEKIGLLRYAYTHAHEELGHERMVVHDPIFIGAVTDVSEMQQQAPLPATDALIHYLYGLALKGSAVARLGYSYWAESVYDHIAPLLVAARESLGLSDANMSFFVAHSGIDAKHADEVVHAITKAVTTQEQADRVYEVAMTTLWLTTQLLDQAYDKWAEPV